MTQTYLVIWSTPNCPFDYCLSTSPLFDLNQPNGADAQCAFNRPSLLCGSCKSGLRQFPLYSLSKLLDCITYCYYLSWNPSWHNVGSSLASAKYDCCSGNFKWTHILCQCCLCIYFLFRRQVYLWYLFHC